MQDIAQEPLEQVGDDPAETDRKNRLLARALLKVRGPDGCYPGVPRSVSGDLDSAFCVNALIDHGHAGYSRSTRVPRRGLVVAEIALGLLVKEIEPDKLRTAITRRAIAMGEDPIIARSWAEAAARTWEIADVHAARGRLRFLPKPIFPYWVKRPPGAVQLGLRGLALMGAIKVKSLAHKPNCAPTVTADMVAITPYGIEIFEDLER